MNEESSDNAGDANPAGIGNSAFIGTWRLLSFEALTSDMRTLYPYGSHPKGLLIYDGHGNMAVQLLRAERQRFSTDDKSQGSVQEIRGAFTSYEAYFGTYEIDEHEGTVTHRLEAALFPNWSGSEQKRYFEFSGPRLTLRTPSIPYGGTMLVSTLVWERTG